MKKMQMCRICLVENVRMYAVVNKNLHELYEKLTDVPFVTEDSRPILACFFCCTKLKQCCQFRRKCLKAEELFAQMMNEDYERDPLISQGKLSFYNGFMKSPTENINIVGVCQIESIVIKEELPEVCEEVDVNIEPKQEHKSDEIKIENVGRSYPVIKNTVHHSEQVSEYEVSIVDIKIEVADEGESTVANRRTLQMLQDMNIPLNTQGEDINYAQNDENLTEREMLQDNIKFTGGNIQIQDDPSDDSVNDPNYINYSDSDSDSDYCEECDDSFHKENRKKKVNHISCKIDPMISNVTDTSPISIVSLDESHKTVLQYIDTQPITSKIVKNISPSGSSSSDSSNSTESSSSDTETEIVPTASNIDCISRNANNISRVTEKSPISNFQTIVPQDENIKRSPIIDIKSRVSNQTNSKGRGRATSSTEPISADTTSHENKTDNKIGRKRKSNSKNWMSVKAKVLRNHGKSYVTHNNILVPARRLKTPCGDKCKLKCKENITEIQRQHIFEDYWNMGDLQRQREFIMRHMSPIKPRYSYKVHNSNRANNSAFYVPVEDKKIRVCKTFFKATLDINDRVIKTVIGKTSGTAILEKDRRGRHQNHAQLDPVIKDGIRKHLDSIRRIESLYGRANTKRTYIDGSKTVADLHRDYVAECKAAGVPFGNYFAYYKIFRFRSRSPKTGSPLDCSSTE